MRFACAVACGLVAWSCGDRAVGLHEQVLFSPDAIWVWWIFAVLWLFIGFSVLIGGVE